MPKINIFGDSHVAVLRDSIGGKLKSIDKNIWRNIYKDVTIDFYNRHGQAWRNFKYYGQDVLHLTSDLIKEHNEDPIDYAIDLNKKDEIFVFSGIMHTPITYAAGVWKSELIPWHLKYLIEEPRKLVSTDVLHHMIYSNIELMLNFLKILKKSQLNLLVLDSPRPLRRSHYLYGVDHRLIIALDRVHREVVLHHLEQNNIEIVKTPNIAFDNEGFQKIDYSSSDENDPHHGNHKWGLLMLEELLKQHGNISS